MVDLTSRHKYIQQIKGILNIQIVANIRQNCCSKINLGNVHVCHLLFYNCMDCGRRKNLTKGPFKFYDIHVLLDLRILGLGLTVDFATIATMSFHFHSLFIFHLHFINHLHFGRNIR